jgi:site-specific DNA-methyltransferase (adenine-specific)
MKSIENFIDQVTLGDSLEVLREIPDNSVDTIITDPPYGLSNHSEKLIRETLLKWLSGEEEYVPQGKGFMGKSWDSFVPPPALWKECFRVMKPGGIILVFAGPRSYDLMTISLRLAGFEIKDTLMWIYSTGFPKSLNIGKSIDKLLGNEREIVGPGKPHVSGEGKNNSWNSGYKMNYVITRGHNEWEGYGTSLKPAYEPIIMAMKPLDGTYAENALKWGVAGLNIDETRIETNEDLSIERTGDRKLDTKNQGWGFKAVSRGNQGRFPANILLDEVSAEILDNQSDGASRFFYVAKADTFERDAGLEEREKQDVKVTNYYGLPREDGSIREIPQRRNNHPTVKPIDLINFLVKLTKMPNPNQIYLDPFLGSGTTAIAVVLNRRHFIGIEKEPEYVEIARARIEYWSKRQENVLFDD